MKFRDLFRRQQKPAPRRRAFEAAQTGNLFSDWLTQTRSADADLRYTLKAMRARSRDLCQNNDYARRYLDLVAANVVGPKGIQLQVRAREPNGTLDQLANQILERSFYDWGRAGTCTVDGRMSWVDAQRIFIESVARDGECFVLMVRDSVNPWNFRLQFVDPDLIDTDKNSTLAGGGQIRMGIEVDAAGRPVAYHVKSRHPDDYQTSSVVREVRVPADSMIHGYRMDRIGQTRGTPWTATAMTRLKMLGGYEESELVAARVSAGKMGFFTSASGDEYLADGQESDGALRMDVSPGTFEQLPAGVDFKSFDPQHPSTAFKDFEKAMLRGIASGLGVSYTSLANDLEAVSYSSIRQGLIEERDFWRVHQHWMIEHFCQVVYTAWLRSTLDAGVVNLPANKFQKFAATQWVPRGWQWVDPKNEAEAQIVAIHNGLMTRTQALAERGLDIEDVLAERAAEDELAAAMGVMLPSMEQPQAPANPANQEGAPPGRKATKWELKSILKGADLAPLSYVEKALGDLRAEISSGIADAIVETSASFEEKVSETVKPLRADVDSIRTALQKTSSDLGLVACSLSDLATSIPSLVRTGYADAIADAKLSSEVKASPRKSRKAAAASDLSEPVISAADVSESSSSLIAPPTAKSEMEPTLNGDADVTAELSPLSSPDLSSTQTPGPAAAQAEPQADLAGPASTQSQSKPCDEQGSELLVGSSRPNKSESFIEDSADDAPSATTQSLLS